MFKSPEGWSLYSTDWSVNTLIKMASRKQIDFDSRVQRGEVWDKKKSSKYIHSLLWGMLDYNMPHLYSKQNGIYYSIDGKQRGLTFIKFCGNEFSLTGLADLPITIDNVEYNINGKYFKQLPDVLQEKILDFAIRVAILEDAPSNVESEFFERANNGVAVSNVDIALSKNVISSDVLRTLSEHEIFSVMFTKAYRKKNPEKEIIVKTWQVFNDDEPDFSARHLNELMSNIVITDDDMEKITNAYDKVMSAYKLIIINNKSIGVTILKKTHLLSYIGYINQFESINQLADWMQIFYENMPDEYKAVAEKNTGGIASMRARTAIISDSISKYLTQN